MEWMRTFIGKRMMILSASARALGEEAGEAFGEEGSPLAGGGRDA